MSPLRLASIGLLLAAPLPAVACSSDDDGGGGASCNDADDCPHWECTCQDGSTPGIGACIFDECPDGKQLCTDMCQNNGGLVSYREQPNVSDSPECDAYCAKQAECGDSHCNRSFWCGVDADECPETKRAYLKCVVETGEWTCMPGGGTSVSSSCPSAKCDKDAGTD